MIARRATTGAARIKDQAARVGVFDQTGIGIQARVQRRHGFAVCDQLERGQQPLAAHIADKGIARHQSLQLRH